MEYDTPIHMFNLVNIFTYIDESNYVTTNTGGDTHAHKRTQLARNSGMAVAAA